MIAEEGVASVVVRIATRQMVRIAAAQYGFRKLLGCLDLEGGGEFTNVMDGKERRQKIQQIATIQAEKMSETRGQR